MTIESALVLVIGVVGIYFAWKQVALNRERQEERRRERQLAVCAAVYNFLNSTCKTGLPQTESFDTLMRETQPVDLYGLFDEGRAERLSEIRQRAHQLRAIATEEPKASDGPTRNGLREKRRELVGWMEDQRSEFKQRFEASLALTPRRPEP